MEVASARPYASLHLVPERQPHENPTTLFFTGQMPFLPPNQQHQSTEGLLAKLTVEPTSSYARPLVYHSDRRERYSVVKLSVTRSVLVLAFCLMHHFHLALNHVTHSFRMAQLAYISNNWDVM